MMKVTRLLVLTAVVVALASPALAGCTPNKNAGQNSSDVNGYGYTFFVGGASQNYSDMVGRFWQPGFRSTINEGTYDVSQWMLDYRGYSPNAFEMNAVLGDASVNLCPSGELVVVIQSANTNGKGALFAVGRVTELSGPQTDFDFTRTSLHWDMTPVSAPPMNASKVGTVLTLNATLPDPAAVFHGLTGVQYTGTITGMRLMRAAGTTTPGPAAANWTYTGSTGVAGAAFGPFTFDCSTLPAGQDLYYAVQLQFVDNVLADMVGTPTQIKCNSGLANPIIKEHKPKKH